MKKEDKLSVNAKKEKEQHGFPDFEINSLARALLPAIQQLFEDEETQKEFEEWQRERQESQLNKKKNNIDKSL